MVEDREVGEVPGSAEAADVGEVCAQLLLPHALAHGLGRKEDDALSVAQHEALDEHEPDVGLAQADAVAQ